MPVDTQSLIESAEELFRKGRIGEAEAQCRAVLAQDPAHTGAAHGLGAICVQSGRYAEAIDWLRKAPSSPEVLDMLGLALAKTKRFEEAAEVYTELAAIVPQSVPTLANLGSVLSAAGRHDEALHAFERARALSPRSAQAHHACGAALACLGRHEEAIVRHRQALALDPNHAAAMSDLGLSLTQLGRPDEAVVEFQRVLAAMPASASARLNLAIAHKNLGRSLADRGCFREAAEQFEQALRVQPDYTVAAYGLGDALTNLGRPQEALAIFEKIIAADPNDVWAHLGKGDALKSIGRFDEARAVFEQAVALAPDSALCHRFLAEAARFVEGDPRLGALEEMARNAETIPETERPELFFALAKAYDELQRHAEAFKALAKANAAKRRLIQYDEAAHLEGLRRITALFTPEFVAAHGSAGDPSDLPIFIVGMPRSGTTLVEQILASHADVFGAGELNTLDSILESRTPAGGFPLDADLLANDALCEIGRRYVAELHALAPNAARITDKMTGNFRLIGLIHLALPNARIIHVKRDPLDTCFSCYAHQFRHLNFTYDLGELGRDYKAYEAMMAHWRRVLPHDAMLEVQYETLVDNFEPEVRRILDHCGLAWDPRCLAFHETQRPVQTESAQQVRRPLSRSAIGRAKNYALWLGPLREALKN